METNMFIGWIILVAVVAIAIYGADYRIHFDKSKDTAAKQ